jgi:hypothetical protein
MRYNRGFGGSTPVKPEKGNEPMFRYTIALDVWIGGVRPTLTDDHAGDLPLGGHLTITLGAPYTFSAAAGQISLPAGSQITGTIVGKQVLPAAHGGNAGH